MLGIEVGCGSTPQRVREAGVEVQVGAHFRGRRRLGLRSGWEHTWRAREAGVEVQCGGARPSCGLSSLCRWLSSP